MKETIARVITIFFVLVFCLRGGAVHGLINLTHLYVGIAAVSALAMMLRYLFIPDDDRGGGRFRLAWWPNRDRLLLSHGELACLLWASLLSCAMFFTYLYTPAPDLKFWFKFISYLTMHFLLFFFYFLSLDAAVIKRMIRLLVLVSIPLLTFRQLYSYFKTGSMISFPYSLYGRAHGYMLEPNEFAKNVVVVVLILLFYIFLERYARGVKLLCFAGIILLLRVFAWSGSRGGVVMLLAGGVLFWLFFLRRLQMKHKLAYYLPIAIAICLLLIFLVQYDFFTARFTGITKEGGNLLRLGVAALGFELIFGRELFAFLFGYGVEFWPTLFPYSTTPHNFILEYYLEFGMILGTLILAALALALVGPLKQGRSFYLAGKVSAAEYGLLKLLFLVAFSSLVPSLFNHSIQTNFVFIFFAGLYFSLYRNLKLRLALPV